VIVPEDPENYVPDPVKMTLWQKTKYVVLKLFQAFGNADFFVIVVTCPDGSLPGSNGSATCSQTMY
jgi:hypothetical protein